MNYISKKTKVIPDNITLGEIDYFFKNEMDCYDYLEYLRFGSKVFSIFTGSYRIQDLTNTKGRKGKCYLCKETGMYFSVLTDSIYYRTQLPLKVWFKAILLLNRDVDIGFKDFNYILELSKSTGFLIWHKIKCWYNINSYKEYNNFKDLIRMSLSLEDVKDKINIDLFKKKDRITSYDNLYKIQVKLLKKERMPNYDNLYKMEVNRFKKRYNN